MSAPVRIHPPHLLIMASAGSGKTWTLSRRMVRLILAGEAPETLVALTFTRKAAGEFFDAVLGCLADAAGDPDKARALARELGGGPERPEDFLPHLRRLVGTLHRLQFTTIDSFFHRIVSAFPFELGLGGSFELMDAYSTAQARAAVLEELLRRDAPGVRARRHFLEGFKQATFGEERKFAASEVVGFVDDLYGLFQDCPDVEAWAGAHCPVQVPAEAEGESAALMDQILARLPAAGADDARLDAWTDAEEFLRDWQPGLAEPSSAVKTIFGNIRDAYDPAAGTVGPFNLSWKKITPDPRLAADLGALVRIWAHRDLRVRIQRTRGTARVLEAYHATYDARVRRAGRLVFGDLPRVIGAAAGGDFGRLQLDYRLDARFAHWLLDEFQDTSRPQWAVLANLIDEVVQDPEERRTFFCVGDVKQSIYGWRGGDHRLFHELRAQYGAKLSLQSLVKTFRCSGAVVELVNAVMGQPGLPARLPGAGGEWAAVWEPHVSHRPDTGFAAYVEAEEGETEGVDNRHRLIAELILEADPVGRGRSCAVLVYSNKEALALAGVLRAATGLPVILEGEIHPALDNSLGLGLLAWLRALAHPTDTLARGWMNASPGGAWLRGQADWRARAFERLHAAGWEEAVGEWLEALAPAAEAGPFLTLRKRQLLAAVRRFAAGGSRDPGALEDYLRHHAIQAPEMPGAIQVMTIHKAKGLGFDFVILTELVRANHHLNQRRDGPLVARDAAGRPVWICESPPGAFLPVFPELAQVAEEEARQNAYEQLCLLYVGLTRAKEALVVVGSGRLPDGKSVHPQHLVREGLAGRAGGRLACGVEAAAVFGSESSGMSPGSRRVPLPPWSPPVLSMAVPEGVAPSGRPSAGAMETFRIGDAHTRRLRDHGIRVHQLLAEVERAAPGVLRGLEARRTAGSRQDQEALDEAIGCLRARELRVLFDPAPEVVVWRERAFQVATADGILSGVFDRVLLWPEPGGGWSRAEVVDFKTDRIEPLELSLLVERHGAQMRAYRAALEKLLGLDGAAIRCRVVSTALREVVDVP